MEANKIFQVSWLQKLGTLSVSDMIYFDLYYLNKFLNSFGNFATTCRRDDHLQKKQGTKRGKKKLLYNSSSAAAVSILWWSAGTIYVVVYTVHSYNNLIKVRISTQNNVKRLRQAGVTMEYIIYLQKKKCLRKCWIYLVT